VRKRKRAERERKMRISKALFRVFPRVIFRLYGDL
jgi:hypothetical protein